MSATRLCLVRHGETSWNAERRIQGQLDVALSAVGLAQAAAVAAALSNQSFSAIYSSDLVRVLETARPAAELFAIRIQEDMRLRERHYGSFQSLTYDEAAARMPRDYARFAARDPEFDFGGGESLREFSRRALACLEAIAGRHCGEEVLVFTHGGVLDVAYRRAAQLPLSAPRDFEAPNAALNWIEAGDEWRILGWAQCGHLQ